MNQKQSWEEEFERRFIYTSEMSGGIGLSQIANATVRSLRNDIVGLKDFISEEIGKAIQTRERELREEWQKLETISKEVEIDNLAMQYELGREDREREISELIEKTIQEERFAGAPYALNRVLGIINNKSL